MNEQPNLYTKQMINQIYKLSKQMINQIYKLSPPPLEEKTKVNPWQCGAKAWQITTSEKLQSPECGTIINQPHNYSQLFTSTNDDSKWTDMNQVNHMW